MSTVPTSPAMTLLASPVRRDILDILGNLPVRPTAAEPHARREGLTASELGARLDLHVTTVRFHVDQLVAAGLVVGHDVRQGVGRPRRHYAAHPGALLEVAEPEAYQLLAEILADAMVDGASDGVLLSAEDAAERWVRRRAALLAPADAPREPAVTPAEFRAKVDVLVALLERWGYDSHTESRDAGRTVEVHLRSCPLLDLAERNPGVACGVHRGLFRAMLATQGEPDAEIGLQPFVEPNLCIARVTARAPFTPALTAPEAGATCDPPSIPDPAFTPDSKEEL